MKSGVRSALLVDCDFICLPSAFSVLQRQFLYGPGHVTKSRGPPARVGCLQRQLKNYLQNDTGKVGQRLAMEVKGMLNDTTIAPTCHFCKAIGHLFNKNVVVVALHENIAASCVFIVGEGCRASDVAPKIGYCLRGALVALFGTFFAWRLARALCTKGNSRCPKDVSFAPRSSFTSIRDKSISP